MLIRLLKFLKIPKNRLDYTELRIYEIIPGLLILGNFYFSLKFINIQAPVGYLFCNCFRCLLGNQNLVFVCLFDNFLVSIY